MSWRGRPSLLNWEAGAFALPAGLGRPPMGDGAGRQTCPLCTAEPGWRKAPCSPLAAQAATGNRKDPPEVTPGLLEEGGDQVADGWAGWDPCPPSPGPTRLTASSGRGTSRLTLIPGHTGQESPACHSSVPLLGHFLSRSLG